MCLRIYFLYESNPVWPLLKTNAILTNHIGKISIIFYENVYVDVDHEGVEPSSS